MAATPMYELRGIEKPENFPMIYEEKIHCSWHGSFSINSGVVPYTIWKIFFIRAARIEKFLLQYKTVDNGTWFTYPSNLNTAVCFYLKIY